MTVRPARTSDVGAIIEMCKSSMRATYGAFFDDEKMAPWVEGEETDNYVNGAIDHMLVAEVDGAIMGVLALDDDLIDLVWVALESRGRGIGVELMRVGESAIRDAGHSVARLEVFEPNTDAIRFYERHGWRRGKRFPDPLAGVDKISMTKPLG